MRIQSLRLLLLTALSCCCTRYHTYVSLDTYCMVDAMVPAWWVFLSPSPRATPKAAPDETMRYSRTSTRGPEQNIATPPPTPHEYRSKLYTPHIPEGAASYLAGIFVGGCARSSSHRDSSLPCDPPRPPRATPKETRFARSRNAAATYHSMQQLLVLLLLIACFACLCAYSSSSSSSRHAIITHLWLENALSRKQ